MKKIALISAIALGGLFYNTANAQILQIGLHLGGGRPVIQASLASPSVAVSYSNADDYYYLPDVDAYYNAYERAYYYNDGDRWVSAAYLPGEYRNYDWRNARHYEVRAHRPYMNADVYREKYRGNVNNWGRDNRGYDDHNYGNRDDRRNNEPRFERRNDNYRGAEHADNRGWGNGNRRDDNRGQDNYNQPSQPGRGNYGQQDWNQRSQQPQQGRGQGGYQQGQQQQQPQQGRGQGGYQQGQQQQQPQQGRGQGGYQQGQQQQQPQQNQPSRQNWGGQQQRGNNGERFTDNHGNGHDRFRS